MTKRRALAAVVVHYHADHVLVRCLESLLRSGVDDIVVVDNGSDDGLASVARVFPTVRVVAAGRNLGFGGGANVGVARTAAPYVLVCNPDVELDGDALAQLVARLDTDVQAALVGPRLLATDGTVRVSGGRFPSLRGSARQSIAGVIRPSGRYATRYRRCRRNIDEERGPDWVTGACMLVRREAYDAVGGFDPGYFMYVEEIDLCWRLRKAGWTIAYEPAASVVHVAGVSSARHPYAMAVAHHRSLWRFARRTASGADLLALPAIALGLLVRCGLVVVRRRAGI